MWKYNKFKKREKGIKYALISAICRHNMSTACIIQKFYLKRFQGLYKDYSYKYVN